MGYYTDFTKDGRLALTMKKEFLILRKKAPAKEDSRMTPVINLKDICVICTYLYAHMRMGLLNGSGINTVCTQLDVSRSGFISVVQDSQRGNGNPLQYCSGEFHAEGSLVATVHGC